MCFKAKEKLSCQTETRRQEEHSQSRTTFTTRAGRKLDFLDQRRTEESERSESKNEFKVLSPFGDGEDVIRVGGRVDNAVAP